MSEYQLVRVYDRGLQMLPVLTCLLCWCTVQAAVGIDERRLKTIEPQMQALVDQGQMAGAVFLLAVNDQILLHEAVGFHDLETNRVLKADALFSVKSMTKPITAVAAMILVDEGRLGLDETVSDYLPDFQVGHAIRVRHLMSHTSGLPYGASSQATSDESVTLTEVVEPVKQVTLEHRPGEGFVYSNLGMQALGRVIEVVSGQSYDEFVSDRVFTPLGMIDSFFVLPAKYRDRVPPVYERKVGTLVRSTIDPTRRRFIDPAGGLFSTARDMYRFHVMMLNEGTFDGTRILSRAAVKTMTASRVQFPDGPVAPGMGLGWWVVSSPRAIVGLPMQPRGSFGHSGIWGTIGWVDPSGRVIGIFMTHIRNDHPGARMAHRYIAMAASVLD